MDDAATTGGLPDRSGATAPDGGGESTAGITSANKLWVGVVLPPASWIVELLARYMATRWSHYHAVVWPFRVVTLLCLAALAAGALICWRALSQARSSPGRATGATGFSVAPSPGQQNGGAVDADERRQNRATLAGWGLGLAAFFLLLILAQAYPVLVLNVGEIT